MQFTDRRAAGRELAKSLLKFKEQNPLILGLPRGGVVVAKEVAELLAAPLDVIGVKKIAIADYPELAIGVVTEDGALVVNEAAARRFAVDAFIFDELARKQKEEIKKQLSLFRPVGAPYSLRDRLVVIVDDGLATGTTARAAIDYARRQGAQKVVFATPIAAIEAVNDFKLVADEIICLHQRSPIISVGAWYEKFPQMDDRAVADILEGIKENYSPIMGRHQVSMNFETDLSHLF